MKVGTSESPICWTGCFCFHASPPFLPRLDLYAASACRGVALGTGEESQGVPRFPEGCDLIVASDWTCYGGTNGRLGRKDPHHAPNTPIVCFVGPNVFSTGKVGME